MYHHKSKMNSYYIIWILGHTYSNIFKHLFVNQLTLTDIYDKQIFRPANISIGRHITIERL